jgi:protein-disulfide isomerase
MADEYGTGSKSGGAWKGVALLLIGLILGLIGGYYVGANDIITFNTGDSLEKSIDDDSDKAADNNVAADKDEDDNDEPEKVEPPKEAVIELEGANFMGDEDAPITIVDYSDYQCPYCSRLSTGIVAKMKDTYIAEGKVKYIFKDFPLSFHKQANDASLSARCAGDQGEFWGMHDLLFENQGDWSGDINAVETFTSYAEDLGLDTEAFTACVDDQKFAQEILDDKNEGISNGVQGTPSLVVNGQLMRGLPPSYEVFAAQLDELL